MYVIPANLSLNKNSAQNSVQNNVKPNKNSFLMSHFNEVSSNQSPFRNKNTDNKKNNRNDSHVLDAPVCTEKSRRNNKPKPLSLYKSEISGFDHPSIDITLSTPNCERTNYSVSRIIDDDEETSRIEPIDHSSTTKSSPVKKNYESVTFNVPASANAKTKK
jgi:hypothetical protein